MNGLLTQPQATMGPERHIGGRLEQVAPRRVTDAGDRLRLAALLAVAVAVHAWVVANTAVPARDALTFARVALQLEHPADAPRHPDDPAGAKYTIVHVLQRSHHPPGFPAAVLVTSWAVRPLYHADLPDQMVLSAQIAGSVAAVLLVFPTYWLGRMLFGKFAGFAAALLVQVLPVIAGVTSEGLTEGPFLLCVGTALALGVRAVRKPGVGWFLLCGLATGLAYLVRPEGVVVGAAVGLVVLGLGAARRVPRRAALAWVAALGVGALLVSAPYMVLIENVTNKPAGLGIMKGFQSFRERIIPGNAAVASPVLFAEWYVADKHGSLAGWVPRVIVKEGLKAFHYAPAAFAVLGLILAGRRLRAEPALWVPITFGALMLGLVGALATNGQGLPSGVRVHYVSERHTLTVVYVGCLFAGAGIVALPGLLLRVSLVGSWPGHPAVAVAVLVGIAASCVPKLMKPLHAHKAGHAEAGRYLKANMKPEDGLYDPYEWAQYYAGRTVRTIPPDDEKAAIVYAVMEGGKDDDPHSALPRRKHAENIAFDGRTEKVFSWPPGAPPEKTEVSVYRLDTRKPLPGSQK